MRPHVHHLELLLSDVSGDIFKRLHPGRVIPGGRESGPFGSGVSRCDRVTLSDPVPQPPVQHRHVGMSEEPKHPPDAGAGERPEVAGVVHNHVTVVSHPQVPHIVRESVRAGERVIELGSGLNALVNVEERGARDVSLGELLPPVPLHHWQVPGRIQDPQARTHQVAFDHVRKPFSGNQNLTWCSHFGAELCATSLRPPCSTAPPTGLNMQRNRSLEPWIKIMQSRLKQSKMKPNSSTCFHYNTS